MRTTAESVDDEDRGWWSRPGLYEVADGVWRLPLPLPMEGLTDVNCYVFADGSDVVVVDPGWVGERTDALVDDALATLGFTPGDVRLVVATHNHWDHYSAAVEMRDRHGWPIAVGSGERHTIEGFLAAEAGIAAGNGGYFPEQSARLRRHGSPALAAEVIALRPLPYEEGVRFLAPDEYLADEQVIAIGQRSLAVGHTPGHTRGHVVIEDRARGVVATGDHVLPRITPSLGLEFAPQRSPLAAYLASLEKTLARPDGLMLPAHGNVTSSVHVRARELLDHHEERLTGILGIVTAGTGSALQIADTLRWTRRGLKLEELTTFHRMVAVLEVVAHLQVLEERGEVRGSDHPGGHVFEGL